MQTLTFHHINTIVQFDCCHLWKKTESGNDYISLWAVLDCVVNFAYFRNNLYCRKSSKRFYRLRNEIGCGSIERLFVCAFFCRWFFWTLNFECEIFSTVPPKLNPFQSTVLQLNVGDRASLTCSVIKGDLPLTITWRKDNRIIDASQHISIKQVDHYNSILVIENLGPDHTGNYSCQTRNSAAEVEIAQSLLVNGKQKQFNTKNSKQKQKKEQIK